METWKRIENHPNYMVSDLGNVVNTKTGLKRKPVKIKNGYMTIMFSDGGKNVLEYLHRIVAEAFLPNPNEFPQVNHIDKNRDNNMADNLEWCTPEYNVKYSLGRKIAQYTKSGELVKTWDGVRSAERGLSAKHGSIGKCLTGKYKTAYGYVFKYVDD